LKGSRKKESIYGHVGPCICYTYVNRLHKLPERATSFVILAFNSSCCHALIGLEWRLRIGRLGDWRWTFPFAQKEASPRKEFDRNDCTCATECSDLVSITLLMIKEFSFNDSSAFLLSILLNQKSNKYINSWTELSKARQHLVQGFI